MSKELSFDNIVLKYKGVEYDTDDIYRDVKLFSPIVKIINWKGAFTISSAFNNEGDTLVIETMDLVSFNFSIIGASQELEKDFVRQFGS